MSFKKPWATAGDFVSENKQNAHTTTTTTTIHSLSSEEIGKRSKPNQLENIQTAKSGQQEIKQKQFLNILVLWAKLVY